MCLSVCPGVTLAFLHTLMSGVTHKLILTAGKFLDAFRPMLPFLMSAIMLKLIEVTLPLFQSPLFHPLGVVND